MCLKWALKTWGLKKPGHTLAAVACACAGDQSDCQSPHPVAAAHLNFDDALPRPTASVPLALPYPSDWRPASASLSLSLSLPDTGSGFGGGAGGYSQTSHRENYNNRTDVITTAGWMDTKEPEPGCQANLVHAIKEPLSITRSVFKTRRTLAAWYAALNCNTSSAVHGVRVVFMPPSIHRTQQCLGVDEQDEPFVPHAV